MCAIQRRASAPDPCRVRREGVHARNPIGDESDPVVAFAEVHGPAKPTPFRELSAVPVEKLHARCRVEKTIPHSRRGQTGEMPIRGSMGESTPRAGLDEIVDVDEIVHPA